VTINLLPEKHPAGSGPYANSEGIISLRFPPTNIAKELWNLC